MKESRRTKAPCLNLKIVASPICPPEEAVVDKKNLSRNLDLDLFAKNGENGGSGIRKCLKSIWFIRLNSSKAFGRAIKYVQALR